jgi:Na+-driven multidrug efflux pump
MYLIRPVIFPLLGTDANTYGYCSNYVLWTITIGGIPTVLNRIVVSYSNQAIAGMGIAKKIDMLAFAIANGMIQGVLLLIGYTYAAKSIFPATGQKTRPMILSLLRKGGLVIPFMFLMDAAAGANGIPWATPIEDSLACFYEF